MKTNSSEQNQPEKNERTLRARIKSNYTIKARKQKTNLNQFSDEMNFCTLVFD